jgi:hypothetical protein
VNENLGIVVGFLVLTEGGLHLATSEEALHDGDFVRSFEGVCARAAVLSDRDKANSFRTAERLLAKRAEMLKRLAR